MCGPRECIVLQYVNQTTIWYSHFSADQSISLVSPMMDTHNCYWFNLMVSGSLMVPLMSNWKISLIACLTMSQKIIFTRQNDNMNDKLLIDTSFHDLQMVCLVRTLPLPGNSRCLEGLRPQLSPRKISG